MVADFMHASEQKSYHFVFEDEDEHRSWESEPEEVHGQAHPLQDTRRLTWLIGWDPWSLDNMVRESSIA